MYKIRRAVPRTLAAGALLLGLTSCISYHHKAYQSAAPVQEDPSGRYTLAYVEADDLGWFWNEAQAESALRMVRERASRRNVAVVVFVHGWHHSARCCDQNAECFKSSLAVLDRLLEDPAYVRARQAQGIGREVDVIGIYVGWRGRSLPGLADYATFWSRKSTAERVGGGDLRNFLHQLGMMYDQFNAPSPTGRDTTVMGLVTIGHSFGAQAVFRATSQRLERQLVDAGAAEARGGRPATIDGLGDLTVLINPAVEAAAFEPMRRLADGMQFDTLQTPSMVVFSSSNDWPRNHLFPAGRFLGNFLAARSSKPQVVMDRRALGVYPRQQTHTLTWQPPEDSTFYTPLTTAQEREDQGRARAAGACAACEFEGSELEIPGLAADSWSKLPSPEHAGRFDFTAEQSIAGSRLTPITTVHPYSPFLVVRTDPAIVDGHSGIFSHRFTNFLVRYVAEIQAKRLLMRARLRAQQPLAAAASPNP